MTVKLMLQQEQSDCGLICLAMILKKYGTSTTVQLLKEKISFTNYGTSMADLLKVAKSYQLRAKVYYLRIDQLLSLPVPLILHMNANHYVVLNKIDIKKGFQLLDPAKGVAWVKVKELLNNFTGFVMHAEPSHHYACIIETQSYKKQLFSHSSGWLSILLLICIMQLPSLGIPIFFTNLMAHNLNNKALFLLLAFKFIELALVVFRELLVQRHEQTSITRLSNKLIHKLHAAIIYPDFSLQSFLLKFRSLEKVRTFIGRGWSEIISESIITIFLLALISFHDNYLGLWLIVSTGLYLVFYSILTFHFGKYEIMQLKQSHENSMLLYENLQFLASIKCFAKEKIFKKRWQILYGNYLTSTFKIKGAQVYIEALRTLLLMSQSVCVFLVEVDRIRMLAIMMYIAIFNKSLHKSTGKIAELFKMQNHFRNIDSLSAQATEASSRSRFERLNKIELKNISYRYHRKMDWLLRDFNLEIKSGEKIAITGPSGSGKSSLLKIICGLTPKTDGEVVVNDYPIACVLKSYRKKLGIVFQDDDLFYGTVSDNIAMFDPNVDHDLVKRCAQFALIDEEIELLLMGYQTFVGQGGVQLSGGQKQKILLARALYPKPQILFLDEAFCHLDQTTEKQLQVKICELAMTVVCITHRLDNLKLYDRILQLNHRTEL